MVESLALGDYKISFGQGLIVSNDFTPGRSAQVVQAERRSNGFRKHFSTNENDFSGELHLLFHPVNSI